MGQKVYPVAFRLGITEDWSSKWFAKKGYAKQIHEDISVRKLIKGSLGHAGIARIEIEIASNKSNVNIYAARPGIIIGKRGAEVENLKKNIEKITGKQVYINIQEVRKPEINAQLASENIANQLERRVSFRRAMKKGVTNAMRFGAKGIRIQCSGRLGGSEMARTEWYHEGRVPLRTIRGKIRYGFTAAKTTYGLIGVKVWIFEGELFSKNKDVGQEERKF